MLTTKKLEKQANWSQRKTKRVEISENYRPLFAFGITIFTSLASHRYNSFGLPLALTGFSLSLALTLVGTLGKANNPEWRFSFNLKTRLTMHLFDYLLSCRRVDCRLTWRNRNYLIQAIGRPTSVASNQAGLSAGRWFHRWSLNPVLSRFR